MDRNSIIGILLIIAILFGYQYLTMPSAEERARMQHEQDSIAEVAIQKQAHHADSALSVQQQEVKEAVATAPVDTALVADSVNTDSILAAKQLDRFGIFGPTASGRNEVITIANENLQVAINTFGARPNVIRLKGYKTYHGRKPLLLSVPDSGAYEYNFFMGNRKISTKDMNFAAEKIGTTGVKLTAATTDPSKYFRITYQLDSATWFMNVTAELVGLPEVDPRNVMFHWNLTGYHNEKHRPTEEHQCTVYYKYLNDDRDYLSESKDDVKKLEAKTNWVAFKQDFFTVAMIKKDGFASNGSEISITTLPDDTLYSKRYDAKLFFGQEPSEHATLAMQMYLGPNQYNTLRQTDIPEFSRIIDLGWGIFGWMNRFLVIPIFNFLSQFNLSYGIIILVLTVVIKMLLLPIAYRNQKSSIRMRALKPEIAAITAKYGSDDAMKKQQATMDLYRKAGVSPVAGCVPMLLQMPVLYAMFRFFPSSIELRQQSFLWADDLSSYDSIAQLPFHIPAYGSHVSLFTLLMAASTIVYTLVNSKHMPQQQGMPNMKVMMYLFPVMMLFFMNSLPAGLSYYYFLANLISILQMTVITKWFLDEDKLRAQLLANMKKPRKKSKWQQRMEEIQKQQQASKKRR
ncbi:MAG: membrane protein insertase YidC [Flavobacteriales bacterium]|jgi:YidC/Oxa1 family membrane protein insertase|nr:membrane protein insertase YidC [Flavobacteriales bacterium]MCB0758076.1 membrane protein insertase YidC [Flavobacteriales bacterium]